MDRNEFEKAQSFTAEIRRVSDAFQRHMGGKDYHWVAEVTDEYIVAEVDAVTYRVPYSKSDDGYDFAPQGEWTEVREQRVWEEVKSAYRDQIMIARSPHPVKMTADGTLEAAAILFGDENTTDVQGDYFDAGTHTGLKVGSSLPLFYDHGGNPMVGRKQIGEATVTKVGDGGVFVQMELDKSFEYREEIKELVEEGVLGTSTGALPWLVDGSPKGKSWYWKQWIAGELSLTVRPAEPRMQVQTAKAFMKSALTALPKKTGQRVQDPEPDPKSNDSQTSEKKMDPEQFQKMMDGLFDRFEGFVESTVEPIKSENETLKERVEKLEGDLETATKSAPDHSFDTPALITHGIKHYKYDHMSPGDLALMIQCLKVADEASLSFQGNRAQPVAKDAYTSLAMRLLGEDGKKSVHARAEFLKMAHTNGLTLKANELHQSDLATAGDEWVGVAYSSEIWDEVHEMPTVFNKVPSIEMPEGAESMVIGTKDGSVTFYTVAQAASQAANPGDTTKTVETSKMTTGSVSLTLGKLGAAASYTGELREDAFVPFVATLRQDMVDEAMRTLDHIVIDGDTATGGTTNINDIGGTPAGDEAFLIFNGFRKLALVTNTANSRDGGTITEEDVLETVKLMGDAGIDGADVTQTEIIVDLPTYWKMLELAKVNTRDVNSQATIENGQLTRLYGYNINRAAYMHRSSTARKANTAGKIDQDTTANNTTGSMLGVRYDQWKVGWRRRFSIEVERVPRADAFEFTGFLRLGMVNRSNEASAISYNLTV